MELIPKYYNNGVDQCWDCIYKFSVSETKIGRKKYIVPVCKKLGMSMTMVVCPCKYRIEDRLS
jgi:hypothetical protein